MLGEGRFPVLTREFFGDSASDGVVSEFRSREHFTTYSLKARVRSCCWRPSKVTEGKGTGRSAMRNGLERVSIDSCMHAKVIERSSYC